MIINNDFEIAEKFIFDGIHLGQTDRIHLIVSVMGQDDLN